MSKTFVAACLLLLPLLAGCTLPEMLFTAFGDSYSAAGPSQDDRRRHFYAQVEASQAYAAANRDDY